MPTGRAVNWLSAKFLGKLVYKQTRLGPFETEITKTKKRGGKESKVLATLTGLVDSKGGQRGQRKEFAAARSQSPYSYIYRKKTPKRSCDQ